MSLLSRRRLWSFFEALYSRELNEHSERIETPEWIKTPLLLHQQAIYAAALTLEKSKLDGNAVGEISGDNLGGRLYTSYGILGDHVGSGKSLCALALVKAPAPPSSYTEYVVRNGQNLGEGRDVGLLRVRNQLRTSSGLTLTQVSASLFLVPHALLGQWENYVARDTHLKALFVKKKQDALAENLLTEIEKYDAIFVSSTMWATLRTAHPLRTLIWKRVFLDEADSISISTDTDEIHGLFYWFITASWLNLVFSNGAYFNITNSYSALPDTPHHVIERVAKLQSGSNMLSIAGCKHLNIVRRMCGISSAHSTISLNAAGSQSARLILHSSEEFIQQSFRKPTITHTNIVCATPANIRVLDDFISTEMLERLNAGDITGALETIGMQAHTESEIVDLVTTSLKKELDQAKRTHEFKKTIEYSSQAIKDKAMESCEKKIASIESRITAIQDRIKRSSDQTCPICYSDNITNPAVTPCCMQLFCFSCLCESLKRVAACPLCRDRIPDLKTIQVVGNAEQSTQPQEPKEEPSKKYSKKEALVRFLKANPTAKVLMFSGYDASFSGLEQKLTDEAISYATVNGSNSRITKLLKEFKAGKYNILFLNARNMGAGLNIESASHVVLFHRMSAEMEKQIIGRAMRLGRTSPLDVVHLLHENEMGNVISHV
jgi:hypothetical protein